MFKEKYQKDNEKISADPAIRQYIKSKFKGEKMPARKKIPVTAYVAAALSVCLAVGIIFVSNGTKEPQMVIGENGVTTNLTYNTIYDSINSIIKQNRPGPFEYLTDAIAGIGGMAKDDAGLWLEGDMETAPESDMATGTDVSGDSSTTNNQVEGVDEADRVKNDGKYIYVLSKGSITIADSNSGKPQFVSKIDVTAYEESASEFYVKNNRLAVVLSSYSKTEETILKVYNIEDKKNPTLMATQSQSGYASNSRLVGDTVYLLSNYSVYSGEIKKSEPATFVPCVGETPVAAEDISLIDGYTNPTYLVITATNLKTAESTAAESVLGGAENIYCNTEHLFYTFTKSKKETKGDETTYTNTTTIVKMALAPDDITLVADGVVSGTPLNQFSMDEYEGNLRIVTTVDKTVTTGVTYSDDVAIWNEESSVESGSSNALYVLNEKLDIIGSITDLAKGERVYSVRFDKEIGYFVTFRQVDPLFTVDLSDPTSPKVLGELKIPGFSEYLHPYGEGLLFGFGKSATESGLVTGLKLSMFDVSNPADVTENDVTPIDADWSEASYNHKAIMVDKNKNIIAFAANNSYGKARVYIFGYTPEKGFTERAELITSETDSYSARFLWIGNHFYVATESAIYAYTMDIFAPTGNLELY